MNLLIFFAIPIATILLAIVFERLLKSPILVAITFFSIYLVVLFALFAAGVVTDLSTLLIGLIVYTILAYITAVLARFIRCICQKFLKPCCSLCPEIDEDVDNTTDNECYRNSSMLQSENENMDYSENIIPNQNNSGRLGMVRRNYRRY